MRARSFIIALVTAVAMFAALPLAGATTAENTSTWKSKAIPVDASHAAYVPSRDTLLVAVAPTDASVGNELLEMDPRSGVILRRLVVGSQPVRVAVSDDGTTAYVALAGVSEIVRVDLESFTIAAHISIPQVNSAPLRALDLAVKPGDASVVVAAVNRPVSTFSSGYLVMAFGHDTVLPNRIEYSWVDHVEFADASTVYGFNELTTSGSQRMTLDETGVTTADDQINLHDGEIGGRYLATEEGILRDLDAGQNVRSLPAGGRVEISTEADVVAWARTTEGSLVVAPFSLSTGAPLGEFTLSAAGTPTDLVATASGYAVPMLDALVLAGTDVDTDLAATVPPPTEAPSIERLAQTRTALKVADMVWDPTRNLLYASVLSASPTYPNEVVAIDGTTQKIVKRVNPAGTFVGALAATSDFSKLYVGNDAFVRVIDLATFTESPSIAMQRPVDDNPIAVTDIEAVPASSTAFVVVLERRDCSCSETKAVVAYENGLPLTTIVAKQYAGTGEPLPTAIHFANDTDLYGAAPYGRFVRMAVSDTGVQRVGEGNYLFDGYAADFEIGHDGNGWATNGVGFVAGDAPPFARRLPSTGGVAIDESLDHVVQADLGAQSLYEYDALGRRIGSLPITQLEPYPWTNQVKLTKFGTGYALQHPEALMLFSSERCGGAAVTIAATSTTIDGTEGDDVILGTPGDDVIDAKGGNDVVCGLGGNDTILGGLGNDYLFGAHGDDTIDGGFGTDFLFGENGTDTLRGGPGNDRFDGGFGGDDIDGGLGTDIYSLGTKYGVHIVRLNNLPDDGFMTLGPSGVTEGDNVRTSVEVVIGSPGSDKIYGSANSEWFRGMGGNDLLRGGGGNDKLEGGDNQDVLYGDDGDDFIIGSSGTDSCQGGAGADAFATCESARQ